MGESRSLLGRIITWTIVGILAIVAFRIALRVLGFAFGILGSLIGVAMFLLFTLGPILLLGWLSVKAWKAFSKEKPAF